VGSKWGHFRVSATTLMTKLPVWHSHTTSDVMMTVVPTAETSYQYIRWAVLLILSTMFGMI